MNAKDGGGEGEVDGGKGWPSPRVGMGGLGVRGVGLSGLGRGRKGDEEWLRNGGKWEELK